MQIGCKVQNVYRGARGWRAAAAAVTVALVVAGGLVAGGPAGAAPVNPNASLTASSTWLETVNAWRAASDLAPVTEDATWTAGEVAHSTYVVKTGSVVHAEDPLNPNYSADGDTAGQNGNVAASSNATKTDRQFVEQWLTAPFHAAGLLDPKLVTSAFGAFRDATGTPFKSAATMDVVRGRTGAAATGPIYFPGDDSTLPFAEQSYHGGESPDPLSPCAGYNPGGGAAINTGVPLFALLPNAPTAASLTATVTPAGGTPIESCAYDETGYTNPDSNEQATGQLVLASRHQVVIVPREPLTEGTHYVVNLSVTYQGDVTPTAITWEFTADARPAVSIGNASVIEGNLRTRQMRFTVSLSTPTTEPVSVNYATVAGTATAGSDFVAKSGTVNIAPGGNSAVVSIDVKGDKLVEPQETFTVKLSNAVNALRWRSSGIGTIIGDDSPPSPTPEVSIGAASLVEGNASRRALRFAVTLSSAASVPVSFDVDTHAGTADPATDYAEMHDHVTIPARAVSGVVLVRIRPDLVPEPNETFTVKLTSATGATIRRDTATGTIIDDD